MEKAPTRDVIVASALKEFAQYGYDGARIDRIAKRGKINKAMIYYHFKGKEQLYEEILVGVYNRIRERLKNLDFNNVDNLSQLEMVITTALDFIKGEDTNFVRIMLREISSGGKYFIKLGIPSMIIPMAQMIEGIIKDGIKKGTIVDVHPIYTFIQLFGSIIFFNASRILIGETDFGKAIYTQNSFDLFGENMIKIIKFGLMKRKG